MQPSCHGFGTDARNPVDRQPGSSGLRSLGTGAGNPGDGRRGGTRKRQQLAVPLHRGFGMRLMGFGRPQDGECMLGRIAGFGALGIFYAIGRGPVAIAEAQQAP